MRLVTYRQQGDGCDRIGAIVEDAILDLTTPLGMPSMLALIEAGEDAWRTARAIVAEAPAGHRIARDRVLLRAPIPLPPQFRDAMAFHQHVAQGMTNGALFFARQSGDAARIAAAEAARSAFKLPEIHRLQPVYYKGNRFAIGHPDEEIVWPDYSELMDFELELACVIGRGGRDIKREDAMDHVFGFTILNDLSARDAQRAEMAGMLGPAKGKDFDQGNVFGPCLVTRDEIGDPYSLRMRAWVNGELWCDANSSTMNWRFEDLIAHISRGETLYPGEIIGSGTVGGGCGMELMRLLQDGDEVTLEIERIGRLSNRIVRRRHAGKPGAG